MRKFKTYVKGLCINDVFIPDACLEGYEKLANKLLYEDMKDEGVKIVLSRLITVINSMDSQKRNVLEAYYGLKTGIPIGSEELGIELGISTKQINEILTIVYSFLKRRFYLFIKEVNPSLFFFLYNLGVTPKCFRRFRFISLELFLSLSESDLKKIVKSQKWYEQVSNAQTILRKNKEL